MFKKLVAIVVICATLAAAPTALAQTPTAAEASPARAMGAKPIPAAQQTQLESRQTLAASQMELVGGRQKKDMFHDDEELTWGIVILGCGITAAIVVAILAM